MEDMEQGTALHVQVTERTFNTHNSLLDMTYSGVCACEYACDRVFLLKTSVPSYYFTIFSTTIIPLLQTCYSHNCYYLSSEFRKVQKIG